MRDVEAWLNGHAAPPASAHGRAKVLLRAALELFDSASSLDRAHCSDVDRALIEDHLPPADGWHRVVIATPHAARAPDDDRPDPATIG